MPLWESLWVLGWDYCVSIKKGLLGSVRGAERHRIRGFLASPYFRIFTFQHTPRRMIVSRYGMMGLQNQGWIDRRKDV